MLGLAAFTVFIYMTAWFAVSRLLRRNDVADIAWGLGFVVLAWTLYIQQPSAKMLLASVLVTIWGLRLSLHIYQRNRKKAEDYRYLAWRQAWGKWFGLRSFLQIFMLQGLLLITISAPLLAIADGADIQLGFVNYLGVAVWIGGFVFEAMSDNQLRRFLQNTDNKGKIMQQGLWRYSRHPNYFGEVVQWWGVWLVSYGSPWFIWVILGPLTITILILKVSGIPLLEKKYSGNRKYEAYKLQTSKFWPLPTKKG